MSTSITIQEIEKLIPHRFPMLLVDKIVEYTLHEEAVGIKNVTMNEWFFQGHFPGHPVMPGVLIVEAMAQTAGILVMKSTGKTAANQLVYFMSIDEARFRKPVVPGDTMKICVKKDKARDPIWKFSGKVYVGDILVAESIFSAIIMNKPESN
ncbi:MAG: 3-hydroxyacyl-ACP dehydratase FabZ [Alphaproteobacteria bacterium]